MGPSTLAGVDRLGLAAELLSSNEPHLGRWIHGLNVREGACLRGKTGVSVLRALESGYQRDDAS
jgi:hypothetical protein